MSISCADDATLARALPPAQGFARVSQECGKLDTYGVFDSSNRSRVDAATHRAKRPIRALVLDDNAPVRRATTAALSNESDIEVIAEFGNADECLRAAGMGRPDVVVLELCLGKSARTGIELASALSRAFRGVHLVFYSDHVAEHYAELLTVPNALGYVLKCDPPGVVVEAVRTAARGDTYLSQATYDRVVRRSRAI